MRGVGLTQALRNGRQSLRVNVHGHELCGSCLHDSRQITRAPWCESRNGGAGTTLASAVGDTQPVVSAAGHDEVTQTEQLSGVWRSHAVVAEESTTTPSASEQSDERVCMCRKAAADQYQYDMGYSQDSLELAGGFKVLPSEAYGGCGAETRPAYTAGGMQHPVFAAGDDEPAEREQPSVGRRSHALVAAKSPGTPLASKLTDPGTVLCLSLVSHKAESRNNAGYPCRTGAAFGGRRG